MNNYGALYIFWNLVTIIKLYDREMFTQRQIHEFTSMRTRGGDQDPHAKTEHRRDSWLIVEAKLNNTVH